MTMNASRREFLKQVSALSLAGVATPLALNLSAISNASAATATDYKAIVCVFLYGGNDYANTLIPYDQTSYDVYNLARPDLAYLRTNLTPLIPLDAPADINGMAHQYALAPELAPLKPIFDAGKMAVVLNVGSLIEPTTKTQLQASPRVVKLPPKLFSHNDQQSYWQSISPEGAITGWGGRLGDLALSMNGNATFTCINVSANAVFMSGENAIQYKVSANGATPMNAVREPNPGNPEPLFGSRDCRLALEAIINQPRTHLLEKEFSKITKRSVDAFNTFNNALLSAPTIIKPFPDESLSNQLKFVARSIASASQLGVKRQVYFVSLGGFDNHATLKTDHAKLLTKVANALSVFYETTRDLGIANQVTTFTATEFGRTLTSNNSGSDHGWGSMQFVLGGAVNGQRFYGTPPVVANNGPDDVGQGRLVPTTSIEQYGATLGKWFGASDSDLLDILPNLSNFDQAKRNLGFV